MIRTRAALTAAVTAVLAAALVSAGVAAPARADTYPSWDEVQAAKSNAAAAQTQVDRINGLLAQLQTAAAAAGDLAVKRAAESGAAQTALDAATKEAVEIGQQAEQAAQEADELKAQSGRLAAQLTRSGASDVSLRLFLSGSAASSDGLLYQLGAVSKLADRSSSLFARATAQKNVAAALSDQAEVARKERDRLAQEAQQASAQADAAKEAADASVAEQQTRADTLYAQLATLKNTEASVERAYAEGEALRKAREEAARQAQQQQQQQEQEEAANGGGGADSSAPPPAGVVVDPAGAQAYAASRIGAYGWGGDQMGCLIKLWTKESSWRADAYNTSSGAYGIPQALPGSKMASAGADWRTNAATQIEWGLTYIAGRYGSPCAAWSFHLGHNWY
jgi:septal ring factor EnvC (AmiA/AmiB activator)